MIWSGKVINRWSENKFYFTNCKGCRKYGYADIRILCSSTIYWSKMIGQTIVLANLFPKQQKYLQMTNWKFVIAETVFSNQFISNVLNPFPNDKF